MARIDAQRIAFFSARGFRCAEGKLLWSQDLRPTEYFYKALVGGNRAKPKIASWRVV
jgi:hypothetical protein